MQELMIKVVIMDTGGEAVEHAVLDQDGWYLVSHEWKSSQSPRDAPFLYAFCPCTLTLYIHPLTVNNFQEFLKANEKLL